MGKHDQGRKKTWTEKQIESCTWPHVRVKKSWNKKSMGMCIMARQFFSNLVIHRVDNCKLEFRTLTDFFAVLCPFGCQVCKKVLLWQKRNTSLICFLNQWKSRSAGMQSGDLYGIICKLRDMYFQKSKLYLTVFRNRIQLGQWIRRAKMTHKTRKLSNSMFWNAGCFFWGLKASSVACSLL